MIPFYLLQRLNFIEFLIFQILQTLFHFILFVLLLFLGLLLILKEKSQIERKDVLLTGLIVEIATAILSFYSSFFLIGGALTILTSILISNAVDFLILYLRYYEKDIISEGKIFLLFIISFPLAYFISILLTDAIFAIFGIKNAYTFNIF